MARKRKSLEPWQSAAPNGQYVRLAYDFLASPAYKALTKKQIGLYLLACQRRFFTIRHNAGTVLNGDISPLGRWDGVPGVTAECFYLNFAIVTACGVYAPYDRKSFYKDRIRLVEIGLIDMVIDGTRYKPKGKTVFRMSERWKTYHQEQPPPTNKT